MSLNYYQYFCIDLISLGGGRGGGVFISKDSDPEYHSFLA